MQDAGLREFRLLQKISIDGRIDLIFLSPALFLKSSHIHSAKFLLLSKNIELRLGKKRRLMRFVRGTI